MMSKKEFYDFLEEIGGLIPARSELPHPISLFGIECDDGWLELIAELIRELIAKGWTRETMQIKEKFGGLRFYATGLPEGGGELIMRFGQLSYTVCELCGSKDNVKLRGTSWVKTLCDVCTEPWLNRHKRFL